MLKEYFLPSRHGESFFDCACTQAPERKRKNIVNHKSAPLENKITEVNKIKQQKQHQYLKGFRTDV